MRLSSLALAHIPELVLPPNPSCLQPACLTREPLRTRCLHVALAWERALSARPLHRQRMSLHTRAHHCCSKPPCLPAAGIVSSVNRQIQGVGRRVIRDVIQTDAAINPGNSGGPLLDSSGRLIGVNTMIYSPSGGNVGIGFAVPVNTVRRSVAQLIATGRIRRGRIGLQLLGDEPSMHIRHALQLPPGVIVHAVEPHSGAAQAGIRCAAHPAQSREAWPCVLRPGEWRARACRGFSVNAAGEPKPGDLIVAVGGERVQSSEDVLAIVEQFSIGDQVPVTLQRGSQQVVVNVALVEVNDS